MKVVVNDPMPGLRDKQIEDVNRHFNSLAASNLHRDLAHAHKRAEAAAVVAGTIASAEFQAEADLRGITAAELAEQITAKPNGAAQRELQRQQMLARIAAAQTPDDLAAI